jgi:hypothetical protein
MNDTKLKVFTSCTKFPLFPNVVSERELEVARISEVEAFAIQAKLRSCVEFVGCPLTPVNYEDKNSKDGVALQVAGSVTIVNTGRFPIRPGQRICWDLPPFTVGISKRKRETTPRGEPVTKDLFHTVPLDEIMPFDAYNTGDEYMREPDFIRTLHRVYPHAVPNTASKSEKHTMLMDLFKAVMDATGDTAKENALANYNSAIAYMVTECFSRVIGIALSGAAPGAYFLAILLVDSG